MHNSSRRLIVILAILATAGLTYCVSYEAPAASVIQEVNMAGKGSKLGQKVGEACLHSYFGAVTVGDASLKAAAAAGDITTIWGVDHRISTMLGSVSVEVCTLANGD